MKNVIKPSAKNVSVPLGLTAAGAATDGAIQNKRFGSGMISLITSNEKNEGYHKNSQIT